MADNKLPQKLTKTTVKLTRSEFILRPLQGVRQDSNAHSRVSEASAQALTHPRGSVTRAVGINSDRLQKHSTNRKTVIAAGWVTRPISQEIDRIAKESGLTRSRTIATLLEEAVHQRLQIQHAVMLSPLIQKAVQKAFQPYLPFLISIAYDSNQTRALTGNVLANTTRPEEMEEIRRRTAKKARESILHQRPQITELVQTTREWFAMLEKDEVAEPA
jgi:hypothetical protein